MKTFYRLLVFAGLILLNSHSVLFSQESGVYFSHKQYKKEPLPMFGENKHLLPNPVLESNPELIKMYWKCWEIAFSGLKQLPFGSPLVSNWLDEAFSENIFQWDTIFMTMFARYGHQVFPAIQSLDNFYALQNESGYICREYREADGKPIHYHDGDLFHPMGWKNTINPPLFAWAEVESFRLTGDKSRFQMVLPVLEKYAEWLNKAGDPESVDWENNGRRSIGTDHMLFWNTPLGSGMDNTPRPANNGAGWVEMSAQMVIMYNNLAIICEELGLYEKAAKYIKEGILIGERINKWCWNEEDGFYYDVLADGTQFRKKTIGGFWTLLAGIASDAQAARLIAHLKISAEFNRPFLFPTLSADEAEYDSLGGYWLGGVWAPTNVMIIKGLEKYGYEDFAEEASFKYLNAMAEVFKNTGTVWENYSPEFLEPGKPAKPDFVGWTGCGPIALLIENVIGLRADGVRKTLHWYLHRTDKHGVENLMVGDVLISIVYNPTPDGEEIPAININCNGNLKLVMYSGTSKNEFNIDKGESILHMY